MATTNRILQLLRTSTIASNKAAAKTYVEGTGTSAVAPQDGEIRLARYWHPGVGETGAVVKSLICVYHKAPSLPDGTPAGWTYIEDATASGDSAAAISAKVDNIIAGVELNSDGTYTAPTGNNLNGETVKDNLESLNSAIDTANTAIGNLQTAFSTLENTTLPTNYKVKQNAITGSTSEVSAVMTDFSQNDQGVVTKHTQNLGNVQLGAVDTTTTGTTIATTDTLATALHKLENSISSVSVTEGDGSVDVAADGRTLSVNVDGTTIVKGNGGALGTSLSLASVTPSNTNVREEFALVDGSNNPIGSTTIKVYKDSALQSVKLLHATSSTKPTYSNGVWTDIASADQTEANLALCYAYLDVDGNTVVEAVPVGNFLRESEYGDGLSVSGGIVSVKYGQGLGLSDAADTDNRKKLEVKIDSTSDPNGYLTVGANGVALNGNAIDAAIADAVSGGEDAIANLDAEVTSNDGTNVQVKVTEVDGVITAVNITTDNTVNASDITTAIQALDANLDASGTAQHSGTFVMSGVTEVDGVITAVDSVEVEAAGAAAAAKATIDAYTVNGKAISTSPTLYAGDIEMSSSDSTTVAAAINAGLDQVNGSNAIDVTTKANKQQTISLIVDPNGNDMLTVGSKGLNLSTTWDCGTY